MDTGTGPSRLPFRSGIHHKGHCLSTIEQSMRLAFALVLLVSVLHSAAPQGHDHSHGINREHLKEDMLEMMPEQNLDSFKLDDNEAFEFHYFKMHDYNNDNKLDGIELSAAMTHYHEGGEDGKKHQIDIGDAELADMINQMLKTDDLNEDGYIDYFEFVKAQRRTDTPSQ